MLKRYYLAWAAVMYARMSPAAPPRPDEEKGGEGRVTVVLEHFAIRMVKQVLLDLGRCAGRGYRGVHAMID